MHVSLLHVSVWVRNLWDGALCSYSVYYVLFSLSCILNKVLVFQIDAKVSFAHSKQE